MTNKSDLRIVYMGTPDFAVEPLRQLVERGYRVVAVVTMPDKPIGRHQSVLSASPVKQYALSVGLPVLQPDKLRDPAFLEELRAFHADLQIVVAFRMLPEVVWNMPRLGTFNLHAALLPQYRGAAPINWAIINGEEKTGLTTFFLDHDIDTGRIILQKEIPILPSDNAEDVHDRLMMAGGDFVAQTVDLILRGEAEAVPQEQFMQPGIVLHHAPKIFKETCRIDWTMPARRIYNFVRGLSPYPAAHTVLHCGLKDIPVKLYTTQLEETAPAEPAGSVLTDGKSFLKVATEGGYIHLIELQPAGKKRMLTADFLRGCHAQTDWSLAAE